MLCGAPRGGVAQAGDFLQLPLPARGAQPGLITAPPPPPRPAGRGVSAAGGGAGYNQSQAGNSSRGAGPGCRGWGRRGGVRLGAWPAARATPPPPPSPPPASWKLGRQPTPSLRSAFLPRGAGGLESWAALSGPRRGAPAVPRSWGPAHLLRGLREAGGTRDTPLDLLSSESRLSPAASTPAPGS